MTNKEEIKQFYAKQNAFTMRREVSRQREMSVYQVGECMLDVYRYLQGANQ